LIVADTYNHIIRQITPAGIVTTIAGGPGSPGSIDGAGPSARFRYPYGVAVDGSGNIYVADETNHTIRKITPTGVVGTLAGLALTPGSDDGAGSLARFRAPSSLVIDSAGNLIVSDSGNNTLRKVTPDGAVTTIAGLAGAAGSADGPALQARFNSPWGLAIDKAGNLYVADSGNDAIRKITPGGVVTTLAGLAGVAGSTDGTGGAARFYGPAGVAVDPDGDILVADSGNLAIRRVTPSGVVTTVGGNFHIQSADGIGSDAQFWYPSAIVTDSVGNVYVADTYNHTIRKGGLTGVAVPTSRLFNLSVRANLLASDATADHRLIVGFFVSGGTKPILVRAVGPGLAPYVGGSPVAGDPRIEIYNQATVTLEGSNDDWGGGQDLRDAFNSVGAFPLDPNSRDAASLLTISGLHSVHVLTPSAGIGLVEAYDTGSGTATRLTNISARYTVSPGTGALIAGFVITGTNQKTVLIRGVGPTLSGYGVTDALLDPRLDVYNDKQQPIAGNDNWDPSLSSSFTQVGAFPFVSGSKDAALLISLPPGLYTAQLSENGSDTGEGLIEIYDVGN
ncbi:MAG TPA: NHL repeat-containing protein, partial [Opitutaceae bacterium]|nr:NHL repeat-containing protein [Opitutaceae bacterium]